MWRVWAIFFIPSVAGCNRPLDHSPNLAATVNEDLAGEDLFKERLGDFRVQFQKGNAARELLARFERGEWAPAFAKSSSLKLHGMSDPDFTVKSKTAGSLQVENKVHDVNDTGNSAQIPTGSTLRNSDEEISRWDMRISFGVEANLFKVVSLATKNTINYAVTTSKQLFLVKERRDSTTRMLSSELIDQTDSHGQPMLGLNGKPLKKAKLVTDDGLNFVFQCVYTSRTEHSVRNEGSVSFKAGVTVNMDGGKEDGNISNITATSQWYHVKASDTLLGLLDFCQDAFAQKTKNQVKREIESYMAGATFYEAAAARQRSLLISAALYGDKASRINVDGHHWNAVPAMIDSSEPGVVKVTGRLEHSVAAQTDDVMRYSCVTAFQQLTRFDVDIKQNSATSGWRDNGRSIIRDICHDAFIEFAREGDDSALVHARH